MYILLYLRGAVRVFHSGYLLRFLKQFCFVVVVEAGGVGYHLRVDHNAAVVNTLVHGVKFFIESGYFQAAHFG